MKFTKKDCKAICKKMGFEDLLCNMITDGIKYCEKNKISHVELIMTRVYKHLEDIYFRDSDTIKQLLLRNIKRNLNEEELFLNLNYTEKLTPKRLFILLLERYGK